MHSSQMVILIPSIHMHHGSRFESRLSYHPHGHPRACVLFALTFSFYLLLFLPSLFLFLLLFLTDKKFMANLYKSAKEGVDTNDVLSLPTCLDSMSVPRCASQKWQTDVQSRLLLVACWCSIGLKSLTPSFDKSKRPDCTLMINYTPDSVLRWRHLAQSNELTLQILWE